MLLVVFSLAVAGFDVSDVPMLQPDSEIIPAEMPASAMVLPASKRLWSCCSRYLTSASHLGHVPLQSPL